MFNAKCKVKEAYAQTLPKVVRAAPWVLLVCALLVGAIIGYSVKAIEMVSVINKLNMAHQAELARTIELYRPFVVEMADRVSETATSVKRSAEKVEKSAEIVKKAAEQERPSHAPVSK